MTIASMAGRNTGIAVDAVCRRPMSLAWPAILLISTIAGADVDVPLFSGDISGWQQQHFRGQTQYQVVELDQRPVLQSTSRNSASALFIRRRVDLFQTPYLSWQWRVDRLPGTGDERTRAGDDYAARVYVVIDGGWLPWRAQAVNYVWANRMPAGSEWDNAYAGSRVKMLALRSSEDGLAVWQREKRDVRDDLRRLHGRETRYIDGVAIMTDSDDNGGEALAYYAAIAFTRD